MNLYKVLKTNVPDAVQLLIIVKAAVVIV
jgi:hypothetical protein